HSDGKSGLLDRRDEVEQSLGAAALYLFDQDPAILEAHHAEFADQVGRHRPPDIVIEDKPAVEKPTQAFAANFDRDGILGRAPRRIYFVEIALRHRINMRLGAGANTTDNPHFGPPPQ